MNAQRSPRARRTLLATAALLACLSSAARADVILQYFESRWETIERRLPDVFLAGYDALWVPPPGLADSGGFSVGYDVYDRFNLGSPFNRTLYGTTESFQRLSREMDHAGVSLFIDTVLNHNGFRDLSTPGFIDAGDYPGFVVTRQDDIDGDFHGLFEGGDLNGRLAGLIDIAQEKNHIYYRHPVFPGDPANIPNEPVLESNRRFYPDRDLPAEFGRHPFNLANPLAGDPVTENATGLLLRYLQWMVEVHGVDGFRIDAVKHIPTWFYDNFYDPTVFNLAIDPISGNRFTPFAFGENFTGDFGLLAAYVRKDGYGNRDTLDFPLFFTMKGVFDAGGFGDMRQLEFSSFDGHDGNANDGSLGVLFAGSHDEFGPGHFNGFNNVALAHILTRAGYPSVYYNPKEFGTGRDFPKDGRGDALGNYGTNLIPRLVTIHDGYSWGPQFRRSIDQDVYVYERLNAMLVGLSDRGDGGYDQRTFPTGFRNITLRELTGNAQNPTVDPNDDIFDSITIGEDGVATIRVPRNRNPNDVFHGRGFVVYGVPPPQATLTVTNATGTLGPDPAAPGGDVVAEARRRLAVLPVVTGDTIDITLQVDQGASLYLDDNALLKLNHGQNVPGNDGFHITSGRFAGFEIFENRSPSLDAAGALTGTGTYTMSIDATGLPDGYTYIETVTFMKRLENEPAIFDIDRVVVYLDRQRPGVDLRFPPRTGTDDITSSAYEAVVAVDKTVNSLHVLKNVPAGLDDAQILALLDDTNRARRHDRLEWRQVLDGFVSGTLELTVVAFEETGNYAIQRFGGIGVNVGSPTLFLGLDTDPSASATTFVPFPGTITASALADEIVIRVDKNNGGDPIAFPADYTVSLQVDDQPPIMAVPFDPGLLPPAGRLVQHDQDAGDQFEEFRFVWRGYGKGLHTFRAQASILGPPVESNEVVATTTVPDTVDGPAFSITRPAPPTETINAPATLAVEGSFADEAAFAQVFIEIGQVQQQVARLDDPPTGAFAVSAPVGGFVLHDQVPGGTLDIGSGTYPVFVLATTGPDGTGILSERRSEWQVTGLPAAPALTPIPRVDGDAAEMLTFPVIAVSAADGGSGGADPADFGADGTLTELRAFVRDDSVFVVVRGDMFGAANDSFANITMLLVDVNAGSGDGAKDLATDLTDTSDGLRGEISSAAFTLAPALVSAGIGFDLVVGVTQPSIAAGYTLGSDGLPGSPAEFTYQAGISVSYDTDASAAPGAPGTTIAAPNAIEVRLPFSVLHAGGAPDLSKLRFVAVTASDSGFPSPNTLPENASNAFDPTQTIEETASIAVSTAQVLINEVFTGTDDWIELHNPSVLAADLGGWALRLRDSANVRRDYVFPTGTTLAAGGYLVVSDEGKTAPPPDAAPFYYTGYNIPWDETRGGSVELVDRFGVGRDYVDWRDTANSESSDIPRAVPYGTAFTGTVVGAAARTAGMSLARPADSTDTDTAADWDPTSGADASIPTPAARNEGGATLGGSFIKVR